MKKKVAIFLLSLVLKFLGSYDNTIAVLLKGQIEHLFEFYYKISEGVIWQNVMCAVSVVSF